jgi:hypothetical protein
MTRKVHYPAHCPAFAVSGTGDVVEGTPGDDERFVVINGASALPVDVIVPLTPAAILVYVNAGGDETTLAAALSHKRGRKPTRLFSDVERYVDRADARGEGY